MRFHPIILLTPFASLILASTIQHSPPPSSPLSHLLLPRQDTCPQGTPGECDCSTNYIACDVSGGNWAQGIDNGTSTITSSLPSFSSTSSTIPSTTALTISTTPISSSTTPPAATTTTVAAGPSPQQQCHDRCGGANGQNPANRDWCIAMCGCYFGAAGC